MQGVQPLRGAARGQTPSAGGRTRGQSPPPRRRLPTTKVIPTNDRFNQNTKVLPTPPCWGGASAVCKAPSPPEANTARRRQTPSAGGKHRPPEANTVRRRQTPSAGGKHRPPEAFHASCAEIITKIILHKGVNFIYNAVVFWLVMPRCKSARMACAISTLSNNLITGGKA